MLKVCIYCQRAYFAYFGAPCITCGKFHCLFCPCSGRLFKSYDKVFYPFLYHTASKPSPEILIDPPEDEPAHPQGTMVPEKPAPAKPESWNLAFAKTIGTMSLYGYLFWLATRKAQTTPDPLAISGKYRVMIRSMDTILSTVTGSGAQMNVNSELIRQNMRRFYVQSGTVAWEVGKMVANPMPMPLTKVWASPAELYAALRLTGYLAFARKEHLSPFFQQLMPLSRSSADVFTECVLRSRKSLLRGTLAGVGAGALTSFKISSYLPLDTVVLGTVTLMNGALLTNAFANTLTQINLTMKQSSPNTQAVLMSHVKSFWKKEGLRIGSKAAGGLVMVTGGALAFQNVKDYLWPRDQKK